MGIHDRQGEEKGWRKRLIRKKTEESEREGIQAEEEYSRVQTAEDITSFSDLAEHF